ncbi:MAG TPA: cytochrome c [Candidatus Limnocylindrales bacterium]|nr:cytochrome c [Candidatus Limnocylindrales bacterium]
MKRFISSLAVLALMSGMAFAAEDGAAIFKAKCAMCHGAGGEGKSGPALKGTSLTAAQIADVLTNGAPCKKAPHGKALAGFTADQATAVAAYVKSLK